jgi:dihydrofolate synthase / folylpolyglutamate synthase
MNIEEQYTQTLNYLYNKLPMFTRIGAAAYKPNLNNTIALCNSINNPHEHFKTIHIAGTNGKGSSSAMLAAILQSAGYKVGLYTSPHIFDFRERIRINGVKIEKEFIVNFTNNIKPTIEELEPSFFEITVALAFDYFNKNKVDIAVIETGLGGLLDSTNIITPIVSLITNIGYDHQNLLGNTLQEIAIQKAGIIKQNIPVVISETQPEVENIFVKQAQAVNAPIVFADKIYDIAIANHKTNIINRANYEIISCVPQLVGKYQHKNIKGVIATAKIITELGYNITLQNIIDGLQNTNTITGIRGRFDIIQTQPYIIIDVAHNAEGLQLLFAQINELNANKIHIITGMVKDKDISKALLQMPEQATYYFTQANIPRALPVEQLITMANSYNRHGNSFKNINDALVAAKQNASAHDVIVICGSFFIIAEIDAAHLPNNYI